MIKPKFTKENHNIDGNNENDDLCSFWVGFSAAFIFGALTIILFSIAILSAKN